VNVQNSFVTGLFTPTKHVMGGLTGFVKGQSCLIIGKQRKWIAKKFLKRLD